ncbi:MAG: mechanosensitive ion channel [Synergistaceae bacterium]|nr:mechanosensitive ion channel [Synergistaceae bacterium]
MKRFWNCLVLFAFMFFAAVLFCGSARAESLADYEKKLTAYQEHPLERARELKDQLAKTFPFEDALMRQHNAPRTDIVRYELALERAASSYLNTYYSQKAVGADDTTIIDDDTLRQFLSKKPPFDATFYFQLVSVAARCKTTLETRSKFMEEEKKELAKLTKQKFDLEKKYRLYLDRLENSDNITEDTWNMMLLKAVYEYYFTRMNLLEVSIDSKKNSINALERRVAALSELLDTVRSNVDVASQAADFDVYMRNIQSQVAKQEDIIQTLNRKYDLLTEKLISAKKPLTPFAKYCYSTEQNLIENEITTLVNLSSHMTEWRVHVQLTKELMQHKLTSEGMIKQHEDAKVIAEKLGTDYLNAMSELKKISTVMDTARSFFDSSTLDTADSDVPVRLEFDTNLKSRLNRYGLYIFWLAEMRDSFNNIVSETAHYLKLKDNDMGQSTREKLKAAFVNIRDYELLYVDDYPVTLGKIFMAVITFIIGYLLACYVAFIVRRAIRHHINMSGHTTLVVPKFVKYIFVLFAFMTAMAQLGIPYTALAVAGGALAVAFGFGAQKLLTDIFAGFALLLKNRIHVGDHIMLNGQYGVVKELTLYDTVLLNEDSKDLIVPNSKFFDQEFINLTLDNPSTRLTIDIGVAYGSDLEKVRSVANEVLKNEPLVQKKPYYRAVCDAFDDSSVNVKVQFFADIVAHSQMEIRNAVISGIDEAFRQNGIEIAFPQRDVHIK